MASEHFHSSPSAQELAVIHQNVISWFEKNQRDLPWRAPTRTGWEVMVSEFMLQQTPVKRVLPVWEYWLERWSTPAALAAEDSATILRAWGRLGYPRRALRLHEAAKTIVEKHSGIVPQSYEELVALPGVGSYTAAAISVFAFGGRATVIDTNIRRVHSRLILAKALPGKSLTAAQTRLAQSLMPESLEDSVQWNAATMELGALICTARTPQCQACPVQEHCAWVREGKPPADYTPKGQSWHGTDRQLRGAIMAVLRQALTPVPPEMFFDAHTVNHRPDISEELTHLHQLNSPFEQKERCLSTLVHDGLAQRTSSGLSL
ncbi:A/G-specific adenine glycosylase [Rothia sp. P7181]|uniref:A/G-specific adenine glycosylase n=1 Tax=unclassified Rothia (in: high G+C Gram-positive bacteria) TaxID=2689056 RepID=UPI003AD9745B